MSGTKLSTATLNRMAELLLQSKRDKDLQTKKIEGLINRTHSLVSNIADTSAEDTVIANQLSEYGEFLKDKTVILKKLLEELENIQLPDAVRDMNIDFLESTHGKIQELKDKILSTEKKLDEIHLNVINLNAADKSLSGIEFNTQRLKNEFQSNEMLLKKWMPAEYNGLIRNYRAFQEKLTQYKKALSSKKDTVKTTRKLKEAEVMLNDLHQRLLKSADEVSQREEQHQKRLYILMGLREVCASLGFEEVSGPGYERENDYNSPVIQKFDTLNEGLVTFRLNLNSSIESDSGISLEVCEEEFGKLSDLLTQEYGVETAFKRVGQEDEPKRISETEKPVPWEELRKMRV